MKITIYELLGMIKDGKAPKKIKFKNDDWYWGYDTYIPYSFLDNTPDVQISTSLFHRYRIDYCLNDEVEILEEQKKIPEKLETYKENNEIFLENFCYKNIPIHKDSLSFNEEVIVDKLNEVIHYLDYLKSKGDE